MKYHNLIAIDLAKNIFQIAWATNGKSTSKSRSFSRSKVLPFIAKQPPYTIVMEACATSNHWARTFSQFDHQLVLLSPHHVKPFRHGQKNDHNDALAIITAYNEFKAGRINQVSVKSLQQQDNQSLHRIRKMAVAHKVDLSNQIRGLLGEYGICINKGDHTIPSQLPLIIEQADNSLTTHTRSLLTMLYDQWCEYKKRCKEYDKQMVQLSKSNDACQRLTKIEGIGAISATAIYAAIGNGANFDNGRQFAACLGLTPRQHSSGGKNKLYGITKRGDKYLRCLLVHGARAVIAKLSDKHDSKSQWLRQLKDRVGYNKATVALANKNARVAWAILSSGQDYLEPAIAA